MEQLEDRCVPADLVFTAPSGNGFDDLLLRRNNNRIELFDNGVLVQSQPLGGLRSVVINGASGEEDRLTIDFSLGGLFSVRDGITFNNAPGVLGTDRLTVIGTAGDNTVTMTATGLTVNGSSISYSGVERLQVNLLAGADTVTMTGLNASTVTTVDAGTDAQTDRYLGNFAGIFACDLTLLHFDDVRVHVGGNFSGHLTVMGSGTIDDIDIDGSVTDTGMITAGEDITSIMVMGDVSGTIAAAEGTIGDTAAGGTLIVGGSLTESGTIMAEDMGHVTITGALDGDLIAHGSGTIEDLDAGSVGSSGTIMAEDVTMIMVMGDMAGTVTVSAPGVPGSGSVGTLMVGEDFTGTVTVEEDLDTLLVGGASSGTVDAGDVGTITVEQGTAASPILQIIEGGVRRTLTATRTDNGMPTPSSVVFRYYYDSTGTGDPSLSVRVTNGNPDPAIPDDVPFDLRLTATIDPLRTTAMAAEFDLALLFAEGRSSLRNVVVEGDVLPTASLAARTFVMSPAGISGGIRLPTDTLGAVAVQDDIVPGIIQAASLQAVAFGSITTNSTTTLGEAATHSDAAGLLAPGTATVTANATFVIPFAEQKKVALFIDSGPGTFDVKKVLFADQTVNRAWVTAVVGTAAGTVTTVRLEGDGGSIQTAQPITGAINSMTGPLGDLLLTSSHGIGNVTAPSIFGNIDTNGPIFGTIQTLSGDLGRVITQGSTIVGTTIINTSQGITGQIISRNNLISRVQSQRELTGLIAVEGDIGAAYVNAAGQLVRFGGIFSNGHLGGKIVVLGNVLGDISAGSGLGARVAVRGQPIMGLAPTRTGILGNFNVNGNVDATSAVAVGDPTGVSGSGLIGDAVGGTFFNSGSIRGILAAKGDINFGNTGSTAQAAIFESASTTNPAAAATIDAIFTHNHVPIQSFDEAGMDLVNLLHILADLEALRVDSTGALTGPMA